MKRKIRSKKAFSLAELVVTITIIAIVSGFGVGIFASTMSNYMTASVTSRDQDRAEQIETYIINNARFARYIYFLNDPIASGSYSDDFMNNIIQNEDAVKLEANTNHREVTFLSCPKASEDVTRVVTAGSFYFNHVLNDDGNSIVTSASEVTDGAKIQYDGVKEIRFKFKRNKSKMSEVSSDVFYYLEYNIIMDAGYSIKGDCVLYNISGLTLETDVTAYVDESEEFVVGSTAANTGIAFFK